MQRLRGFVRETILLLLPGSLLLALPNAFLGLLPKSNRRPRQALLGYSMESRPDAWRLSRTELREVLNKYEKAVENDAYYLLQPCAAERKLYGNEALRRRADAIRNARDTNRKFVEAVIEDLPDLCAGPDALEPPSRPMAEFKSLGTGVSTLPESSYGSLASVFLHLLRDWSSMCDHVMTSTYNPALAELKKYVPPGAEVLLPGAGPGRLALLLGAHGYHVEANDASKLFLTFADYLLNRSPAAGMSLYPMAHVFSENWSHEQQYMEVQVPTPSPADVASQESDACTPVRIVPGDFVKTYKAGGDGHRRFKAIVTCFFIDTAVDIVELFHVLDGLLEEGGVWINIGPLNWRKEARLKLCWSEIVEMWERLGYEFKTNTFSDTDYHMPRGMKMYTESYKCALSTAVKRGAPGTE